MNQTAIEQKADSVDQVADPAPAAAAPAWRVFRMNDYEWWMAHSKEEVLQAYVEAQACSLEDCKQYGLIEPDEVVELTEAELDRLIFTDDECSRDDPTRKRSFRLELHRRIRVDQPQFPEMFATTEF